MQSGGWEVVIHPKHPGKRGGFTDILPDYTPDYILRQSTNIRMDIGPPELGPSLAEALAFTRANRDMTLKDVARELGEAFQLISKVEKGHIPKIDKFLKLMVWLQIIDQQTAELLNHYAKEKRNGQ